jgi:hypothetical protein
MHRKRHLGSGTAVVALLLAGLLTWPTATLAQLATASTVTGQATVVQATLLGILGTATTTTLASTAPLASTTDAQDASQLTGNVPALVSAGTLSAATIGYPDQVDSVASLGSLSLDVAGVSISADLVMAQATQVLGTAASGSSSLDNLALNGIPIAITGAPNQTVSIPGGQMVINEQTVSSTGAFVVNALHVTVNGVANVVLASATAGIS